MADLDYGAMRMLRLRAVLVAFLRRWAIVLAIVLLLFSAGSNAPLVTAGGLASTLLLPLWWSAAHGWWLLPATVGYTAIGVVPILVSRALWWPSAWAAAERALPLELKTLQRSDRVVAAVILAPWQALLVLGLGSLGLGVCGGDVFVPTACSWLLSAGGAWSLAVAWMARLRRGRAPRPRARQRAMHTGARHELRVLPAVVALLALPLARGRAVRSATVLVVGVTAACATATASWWSALPIAWALALHALCALVTTTLAADATRRELQPLWLANRALPLSRVACERWRHGLALMPAIAGTATGALAAWATPAARVVPVVAYVCSVIGGCVVEAFTPRASDLQNRTARWLLSLVIGIACASEVMP